MKFRDDRSMNAGKNRKAEIATPVEVTQRTHAMSKDAQRPASSRADGPRFVRLAEIARRWRVHRSTARRILDRGRVRPYALGGDRGGTVRYDLAEILAFETKSRERSS
jgi:hypothetical protein